MSHCTSFTMTFQDKRTLFRALRTCGFQPENRVWSEYQNQFLKRLDIGGTIIGKLLTGMKDAVNVFFIETEEGLTPHFESHALPVAELEKKAEYLLNQIRHSYLQHSVEALGALLADAGNDVSINVDSSDSVTSYVVTLGASEKVLRILMNEAGTIEESVEGVLGRTCVDITEALEQKVSATTQLERTWTHEYDATVEDRHIQILRLS